METLSIDLLENLLSKVDDRELKALYPNLKDSIDILFSRNLFWKKRVESIFNSPVDMNSNNWKRLYYLLLNESNYQKLFEKAYRENDPEVVELLLEDPRVNPSTDHNKAIRTASENGHNEIVQLLLQDPRVDPGAIRNYAIQLASGKGRTEIVQLLLKDPRVDPADRNNYAIRLASKYGHAEIVRLLLQDPRVKSTYK